MSPASVWTIGFGLGLGLGFGFGLLDGCGAGAGRAELGRGDGVGSSFGEEAGSGVGEGVALGSSAVGVVEGIADGVSDGRAGVVGAGAVTLGTKVGLGGPGRSDAHPPSASARTTARHTPLAKVLGLGTTRVAFRRSSSSGPGPTRRTV